MDEARTKGREAILSAAIACAATSGWEATSMEAVRQRAGVSNGSLFHHFPTRRGLTAAVITTSLEHHHEALLGALGADPEQSVRDAVERHLDWIGHNPELGRLLLSTPLDVLRDSVSEVALARNRAFFSTLAAWLTGQGWPGRPTLHAMLALWIGPAQEYARNWVAEPEAWPLDNDATDALGRGAWAALAPFVDRRAGAPNYSKDS